jgi:hypothetical protein
MFAEKFGVEVRGQGPGYANGYCKGHYDHQFWDGQPDGGYGNGSFISINPKGSIVFG